MESNENPDKVIKKIATVIETNDDANEVLQKNRTQIRQLLQMIYYRGKDEVFWQEELAFMTQDEKDEAEEESIGIVLKFVNGVIGKESWETILEYNLNRLMDVNNIVGEKVLSEKINKYFEDLQKEKEHTEQLIHDLNNLEEKFNGDIDDRFQRYLKN